MPWIKQAGLAAVAVDDSQEFDLLSADPLGIPIAGIDKWGFSITSNANVNIKVYKSWGTNNGLQPEACLAETVGPAAPYIEEFGCEDAIRIRITGQCTTGNTASVSCDWIGRGQ